MNHSQSDMEDRLRAALSDHARQAPPGGPLAERILAEVDAPSTVLRPRRGWRTWSAPLLAAAAIAAVVLTVLGIAGMRLSSSPKQPSATQVTTTNAPTPTTTPTPSTPRPQAQPTSATIANLIKFQAVDLTFVGTDNAWALGSAQCSSSDHRRCAAFARSTDGGATWHKIVLPNGLTMPGTTCGDGCVTGVRFADADDGFLFGPNTFLTSTDGGLTWKTRAGGADALETLDETVIRADGGTVTFAPVGTLDWKPATGLPTITGHGVQLARAKGLSYLSVPGPRLYRSTDGGAHWTSAPACLGMSGIAVSTGGTLDELCGARVLIGAGTKAAHYEALPGTSRGAELSAVAGNTLFVSSDQLYRSTDGGKHWTVSLHRAPDNDLGPPGFQSNSLGRWLTDDGLTVWTTRDAGRHWTGLAFAR